MRLPLALILDNNGCISSITGISYDVQKGAVVNNSTFECSITEVNDKFDGFVQLTAENTLIIQGFSNLGVLRPDRGVARACFTVLPIAVTDNGKTVYTLSGTGVSIADIYGNVGHYAPDFIGRAFGGANIDNPQFAVSDIDKTLLAKGDVVITLNDVEKYNFVIPMDKLAIQPIQTAVESEITPDDTAVEDTAVEDTIDAHRPTVNRPLNENGVSEPYIPETEIPRPEYVMKPMTTVQKVGKSAYDYPNDWQYSVTEAFIDNGTPIGGMPALDDEKAWGALAKFAEHLRNYLEINNDNVHIPRDTFGALTPDNKVAVMLSYYDIHSTQLDSFTAKMLLSEYKVMLKTVQSWGNNKEMLEKHNLIASYVGIDTSQMTIQNNHFAIEVHFNAEGTANVVDTCYMYLYKGRPEPPKTLSLAELAVKANVPKLPTQFKCQNVVMQVVYPTALEQQLNSGEYDTNTGLSLAWQYIQQLNAYNEAQGNKSEVLINTDNIKALSSVYVVATENNMPVASTLKNAIANIINDDLNAIVDDYSGIEIDTTDDILSAVETYAVSAIDDNSFIIATPTAKYVWHYSNLSNSLTLAASESKLYLCERECGYITDIMVAPTATIKFADKMTLDEAREKMLAIIPQINETNVMTDEQETIIYSYLDKLQAENKTLSDDIPYEKFGNSYVPIALRAAMSDVAVIGNTAHLDKAIAKRVNKVIDTLRSDMNTVMSVAEYIDKTDKAFEGTVTAKGDNVYEVISKYGVAFNITEQAPGMFMIDKFGIDLLNDEGYAGCGYNTQVIFIASILEANGGSANAEQVILNAYQQLSDDITDSLDETAYNIIMNFITVCPVTNATVDIGTKKGLYTIIQALNNNIEIDKGVEDIAGDTIKNWMHRLAENNKPAIEKILSEATSFAELDDDIYPYEITYVKTDEQLVYMIKESDFNVADTPDMTNRPAITGPEQLANRLLGFEKYTIELPFGRTMLYMPFEDSYITAAIPSDCEVSVISQPRITNEDFVNGIRYYFDIVNQGLEHLLQQLSACGYTMDYLNNNPELVNRFVDDINTFILNGYTKRNILGAIDNLYDDLDTTKAHDAELYFAIRVYLALREKAPESVKAYLQQTIDNAYAAIQEYVKTVEGVEALGTTDNIILTRLADNAYALVNQSVIFETEMQDNQLVVTKVTINYKPNQYTRASVQYDTANSYVFTFAKPTVVEPEQPDVMNTETEVTAVDYGARYGLANDYFNRYVVKHNIADRYLVTNNPALAPNIVLLTYTDASCATIESETVFLLDDYSEERIQGMIADLENDTAVDTNPFVDIAEPMEQAEETAVTEPTAETVAETVTDTIAETDDDDFFDISFDDEDTEEIVNNIEETNAVLAADAVEEVVGETTEPTEASTETEETVVDDNDDFFDIDFDDETELHPIESDEQQVTESSEPVEMAEETEIAAVEATEPIDYDKRIDKAIAYFNIYAINEGTPYFTITLITTDDRHIVDFTAYSDASHSLDKIIDNQVIDIDITNDTTLDQLYQNMQAEVQTVLSAPRTEEEQADTVVVSTAVLAKDNDTFGIVPFAANGKIIKTPSGELWWNCAVDGELLLFKTARDAEAYKAGNSLFTLTPDSKIDTDTDTDEFDPLADYPHMDMSDAERVDVFADANTEFGVLTVGAVEAPNALISCIASGYLNADDIKTIKVDDTAKKSNVVVTQQVDVRDIKYPATAETVTLKLINTNVNDGEVSNIVTNVKLPNEADMVDIYTEDATVNLGKVRAKTVTVSMTDTKIATPTLELIADDCNLALANMETDIQNILYVATSAYSPMTVKFDKVTFGDNYEGLFIAARNGAKVAVDATVSNMTLSKLINPDIIRNVKRVNLVMHNAKIETPIDMPNGTLRIGLAASEGVNLTAKANRLIAEVSPSADSIVDFSSWQTRHFSLLGTDIDMQMSQDKLYMPNTIGTSSQIDPLFFLSFREIYIPDNINPDNFYFDESMLTEEIYQLLAQEGIAVHDCVINCSKEMAARIKSYFANAMDASKHGHNDAMGILGTVLNKYIDNLKLRPYNEG